VLTLILYGFRFLLLCRILRHFDKDETIGADQEETIIIFNSWEKQRQHVLITDL
jgi:hypothetical protein